MPHSITINDPKTLSQIGKVRTESLIPNQQHTSIKLLTSADCYQQRFLKYPGIATFHSFAEYLYALQLEIDPNVRSFVPQPFVLHINKKRYIPDFYILRNDKEYVFELKPQGLMDEEKQRVAAAYFDYHNMIFKVISNEEVLAHELKALNWLPIIQVLVCANEYGLDTEALEFKTWQKCVSYSDDPVIGDILLPGHKEAEGFQEIALYRLIYRHRLVIDLSKHPISYDTVLKRCA
jgi:hypothetical protein